MNSTIVNPSYGQCERTVDRSFLARGSIINVVIDHAVMGPLISRRRDGRMYQKLIFLSK